MLQYRSRNRVGGVLLTYQRGHASSMTSLPELSFAYVVVGFRNYFNKRVIAIVFYC